jgi:hypothetical protein
VNQMKESWINFMTKLNGPWHQKGLWVFMIIVFGHWSEHLAQIYQIYVLGWLPKDAGGILGLWYPWLAQSEVLHIAYNGSVWIGLILLFGGMTGKARTWWIVTLALQCWHLFEHLLLQYQYVTGNFFFGATVQTGIGQLWFPRPELHFAYNLVVFIPMVVAYYYYFNQPSIGEPQHA